MMLNKWKLVGFIGFVVVAGVFFGAEKSYGDIAEISLVKVLSVGIRAPVEVFVQFDPWQILALDFSVGSINDTKIKVDSILGGISVGIGARYFLSPIRFSGISFSSSIAGGVMLTPGKSLETELILALPYILAGTDVSLRALPFLGFSTELRWSFTVPTYTLMVGIKVYLF